MLRVLAEITGSAPVAPEVVFAVVVVVAVTVVADAIVVVLDDVVSLDGVVVDAVVMAAAAVIVVLEGALAAFVLITDSVVVPVATAAVSSSDVEKYNGSFMKEITCTDHAHVLSEETLGKLKVKYPDKTQADFKAGWCFAVIQKGM